MAVLTGRLHFLLKPPRPYRFLDPPTLSCWLNHHLVDGSTVQPPFRGFQTPSSSNVDKTIINDPQNHHKTVLEIIPKWVVYYCFTDIVVDYPHSRCCAPGANSSDPRRSSFSFSRSLEPSASCDGNWAKNCWMNWIWLECGNLGGANCGWAF